MPDLHFFPMACSLASRIAAFEAGVELNYRRVDIFGARDAIAEPDELHRVSSMGKVPVLVIGDGEILTENVAVLQYIADLNPASGLAPPPADHRRYALQQWLSFIGTELHKGFTFAVYSAGSSDPVKTWAREHIDLPLSFVSRHLEKTGDHLLGGSFTVADAYLIWALLLIRAAGIDLGQWPALATYVERVCRRPRVKAAIRIEREMFEAEKRS